jgi:hyperosmotically inducible protein
MGKGRVVLGVPFGKRGLIMSEAFLRQIIIEELEYEPSLDATHIGVAVEKGVVTLTGHVASFAQKHAAITAVRRINGVRAIAEEIEVRYPFEKKIADDEIAKRAVDILDWDSLIPDQAIQVLVRNGWVTLTGDVDWHFQKKSAEDDIRKLSGVHGIINDIAIKPRVQATDVQKKIEDALRRRLEGEVKGIRVTVQDGSKVILEGFVDNWNERQAIETAAWSAPGVKVVDDRLSVGA